MGFSRQGVGCYFLLQGIFLIFTQGRGESSERTQNMVLSIEPRKARVSLPTQNGGEKGAESQGSSVIHSFI